MLINFSALRFWLLIAGLLLTCTLIGFVRSLFM